MLTAVSVAGTGTGSRGSRRESGANFSRGRFRIHLIADELPVLTNSTTGKGLIPGQMLTAVSVAGTGTGSRGAAGSLGANFSRGAIPHSFDCGRVASVDKLDNGKGIDSRSRESGASTGHRIRRRTVARCKQEGLIRQEAFSFHKVIVRRSAKSQRSAKAARETLQPTKGR